MLLGTLLAEAGYADLNRTLTVDLNMSYKYGSLMTKVPTVTTRSDIWVGGFGRTLVPIDKCLLHLLPVHDAKCPVPIHSNVVSDLGGNTLHAKAVVPLAIALRHANAKRSLNVLLKLDVRTHPKPSFMSAFAYQM